MEVVGNGSGRDATALKSVTQMGKNEMKTPPRSLATRRRLIQVKAAPGAFGSIPMLSNLPESCNPLALEPRRRDGRVQKLRSPDMAVLGCGELTHYGCGSEPPESAYPAGDRRALCTPAWERIPRAAAGHREKTRSRKAGKSSICCPRRAG